MNPLNILLSILIVVVGALILESFTIALYVGIQKWFKKRDDITVRNIFLLSIILIAIGVRIGCILAIKGSDDLYETIESVFVALYSSLGSIAFEGQPDVGTVVLSIVYHASALWLALTFVAVITMNISYGMKSRIVLRATVFSDFKKSKKYYIFTSFTEDSLNLAESITENYSNSVIIFVANQSMPYNRENEIHQKIRLNGYLFINYKKIFKKDIPIKSILRRLHLVNVFKTGFRASDIKFFALDNNLEEKGLEAYNSEIIFDEINALLSNNKFSIIREIDRKLMFYVLTNNSLNYEFYEKKTYACIDRADKNHEFHKIAEQENKVLDISIKLVNEADLTGNALVLARHLYETRRIHETKVINKTNFDDYRVVFVGFGQNGQESLCNLFVDSIEGSHKDSKDFIYTKRFVAHVFDPSIDTCSGSFIKSHPSILYSKPTDNKLVDLSRKIEEKDCGNYKEVRKLLGDELLNDLNTYCPLPIVSFYNNNAFDIDVLKEIAAVDENQISAIVIATGDDDRNIELSNAIVQSIRQQVILSGSKLDHYVDIYVNIRNENNKDRLLLRNDTNQAFLENVRVIAFGASQILYSVKAIIDEEREKTMDGLYNFNFYPYFTDKAFQTRKTQEIYDTTIGTLKNSDGNIANIKPISNYYYKMLSSLYSYYFAEYYLHCFIANDEFDAILELPYKDWLTNPLIKELTQLEHNRWMRFMISYGAIAIKDNTFPTKEYITVNEDPSKRTSYEQTFGIKEGKVITKDYLKSIVKIHKDLRSFASLSDDVKPYDTLNVVLGAVAVKEKRVK